MQSSEFLPSCLGFYPGHSTQYVFFCMSLTRVCVCVVIDEGKFEGAVFLNLAKSFDCVNREILLQKFTCYSIQGDACRAFCMADFSWSVGEW